MTEVVEYNYVFVHFDALLCQLKGTGKQFNARLKAATSFARRSRFSEFLDRHHARPAESAFLALLQSVPHFSPLPFAPTFL